MQDNRVIAFASKSLSPTEQRYANIERELLACVFGAERFHSFIFGAHFQIQSDHKPLEMITKKSLTAAPARLQRMLLRLQRYDYEVTYVPGSEMTLADSLSRASTKADTTPIPLDYQVCLIHFSKPRLDKLRAASKADEQIQLCMKYVIDGFPLTRRELPDLVKPYWCFRDELCIDDGILFKGMQAIIPKSLQQEFLQNIHEGHLGITRCQQRARTSVFWPNLNQEIMDMVTKCDSCQKQQRSQKKPSLMPLASELQAIPWYTLSMDLFHHDGKTYLIIADYATRYPIVELLHKESTSKTIAELCLKYFSLFGIPHTVISDNGPQFIGQPFLALMERLGIHHTTSSPHHPESHGFIEREIGTVKTLMKKGETGGNIHLSLLNLRSTPQGRAPSPAELLFGRKIFAGLPIRTQCLSEDARLLRADAKITTDDAKQFTIDDFVYYQDVAKKTWHPGTVVGVGPEPRSYTIRCEASGAMLRRNVSLIRRRPPTTEKTPSANITRPPDCIAVSVPLSTPDPPLQQPAPSVPPVKTSRFGRPIRTPARFNDDL